MVVNAIYLAVASVVSALADASVDAHDILDELVYVGGRRCLPGFDDCICLNGGFTSFPRWTVLGGEFGDLATTLARGCASTFHAVLISSSLTIQVSDSYEKLSLVSESYYTYTWSFIS